MAGDKEVMSAIQNENAHLLTLHEDDILPVLLQSLDIIYLGIIYPFYILESADNLLRGMSSSYLKRRLKVNSIVSLS